VPDRARWQQIWPPRRLSLYPLKALRPCGKKQAFATFSLFHVTMFTESMAHNNASWPGFVAGTVWFRNGKIYLMQPT
jgi:hypothetical protein